MNENPETWCAKCPKGYSHIAHIVMAGIACETCGYTGPLDARSNGISVALRDHFRSVYGGPHPQAANIGGAKEGA